MKKISLVVSDYYLNNNIFNIIDSRYNRDNSLYPYYYLKKILLEKGYDLSTHDINKKEDSDFVIYFDIENVLPSVEEKFKSFLFIFECEVINKRSWEKNNHKYFRKIFTWNDKLIDNKIYFKSNVPINNFYKNDIAFQEKKLCTMISSNLSSNHPDELYFERENAVMWFEKNGLNSFDLYGKGWNKYKKNKKNKILNSIFKRSEFLKKIVTPKYNCYKGVIDTKNNILQKYVFSICYENSINKTGYISEKIFDCFSAGNIPIYLGCENISEHIPENCFINKRDFETYDELYLFLKMIDEKEYLKYQKNILNFFNSEKFEKFSINSFVNQILNNILSEKASACLEKY